MQTQIYKGYEIVSRTEYNADGGYIEIFTYINDECEKFEIMQHGDGYMLKRLNEREIYSDLKEAVQDATTAIKEIIKNSFNEKKMFYAQAGKALHQSGFVKPKG